MSKFNSSEIDIRREIVGVKLKAWREQAKLSQSSVAEKLSYTTPQFISNWERGLSLPPLEVLPKLIKMYGLSAEEMTDVIYRYQEVQLSEQKRALEALLKHGQSHKAL